MEQATNVATEVEQPTLEQLAQEFTVEQRQPAQSEPQVAAPPPSYDDSENFAKWSAQRLEDVTRKLNDVTGELSKKKQDDYVSEQLKALDDAVSTVGKDVEMSKLFIEGALHTKYVRDENFRKIFDNRSQNPTAYKKALSILSDEIKKEASVKYDPQVAEDARALSQLQRNARTGKTVDDPNEKWKGMSAADFDRQWERLRNG
jgi:hypothetical protein